ncbi:MAG: hypothetical protein GY727_04235 [Gammaproteobacteria bacterium]|nr:hypothetical protein [Gammaproteobacteria bacterium]
MKALFKFVLICTGLFVVTVLFFIYRASKVPETEWDQNQQIVQKHYRWLSDIYSVSMLEESVEDIPCDGILSKNKHLTSLYRPYLKRFTTTEDSIWQETHADWLWLNSENLLKETITHNKYNSTYLGKAIKSISPIVAVFYPDTKHSNQLPEAPNLERWNANSKFDFKDFNWLIKKGYVTSANRTGYDSSGKIRFQTGRFTGWMDIIDTQKQALICRARLQIESSSKIPYKIVHRSRSETPKKGIRDDFKSQFEKEIATILPSGTTVNLGKPKVKTARKMPSIFE